jgi:fructoselysine and glucoselysine-specific PTS system IID component
MKSFLDLIPTWVQSGLQVAGNMLPALGFALLMNLMFNKKVAPYFFLGFMLASYLKLPVIAIGGFGVIIALLVTQPAHEKPVNSDDDDFGTEAEAVIADRPATASLLSKKEIRSLFWRSMLLEANFNFETWQNTGFAYAMIPVLKKCYNTKQAMAASLKGICSF